MRRFVEGRKDEYDELRQRLQDGKCHVFQRCSLPDCCSKSSCRIGFELDHNAYVLFIDLGISCSKTGEDVYLTQFKQLLSEGQLIFIDFNDLRVFLKSLRFLYG